MSAPDPFDIESFGQIREAHGYRFAQVDALEALFDRGIEGLELWARHGKNWRDVKPMKEATA